MGGNGRLQLRNNTNNGSFTIQGQGGGTATDPFVKVSSTGLVGIGTDNPSYKLDISGDSVAFPSAAGSTLLRLRDSAGTATLSIDAAAGSFSAIQFGDSAAASMGSILYNHVDDSMKFNTGGTGTKLFIASDGKVGIGTDNPITDLEICNKSGISSCVVRGQEALVAIMGDSDNSGASETDARLVFTSDSHTNLTSPLSSHGFEIALINDEPGSGLRFHDGTANEERLRINKHGKILLHGTGATGSNNNSTLLDNGYTFNIHGTSSEDGISVVRYSASYGAYGLNIGKSRNNNFGTNTAVQDGNELGHVSFYGADGNNFEMAAQITGLCDGAVGTGGDNTDMPGALSFRTSEDGSDSPTEKLRITSGGKIKINVPNSKVGVTTGALDVWGDATSYPILRLGSLEHNEEGELIRFGRTDVGTSDIRYHSIFGRHSSTTSNNYLAFKLHDGSGSPFQAQTEVFTLTGSGKIGINQSSPDALLHLTNIGSAGIVAGIRFESSGTGNSVGDTIGQFEFEHNDANDAGVAATIKCSAEDELGNVYLTFNTGNPGSVNEALRITSSGTAGFGGNSAAPIVDNGELYYRGNSTSTFDNLPQNLYLYSDDIAYDGTNPGAGMVFGGSYHSNSSYTTFAGIHGIKENDISDQYGGALVFGVRPNGAATPWEKVRITSKGTTIAYHGAAPSDALTYSSSFRGREGVISPIYYWPRSYGNHSNGGGYDNVAEGGRLTLRMVGAQGGTSSMFQGGFGVTYGGGGEGIEYNRVRVIFRATRDGTTDGYTANSITFKMQSYYYSGGWTDISGSSWNFTGTDAERGYRWTASNWISSSDFAGGFDVPSIAIKYDTDNGNLSNANIRIAAVYLQYARFS